MAFDETSNGTGMYMPVAPAYGAGNGNGMGFGGDWGWIILLLLCGWGGGFGGGFGGGYGNMMLGYDFPWLLNGQQGINNNVSSGFRDAQLSDGITSIRDGISGLSTQLCGCCGDIQMALSNGFAGTTAAVTGAQNAIAQQLYSNELASLNRSFAEQTANTAGFTSVNSGIADLRYTEATEACATRTAAATNTRDIIDAQDRGIKSIMDKLCQLELDNYKRENDQLRSENSTLRNQGFIANEINQQNEVFYNRLKNCPVNAVPVAGNTPLFSCNPGFNTPGCGCGCGAGSF